MLTYDLVIAGAGIIGLSVARLIKLTYPTMSVAIVEKNGVIANEQTGHNSGVIHSGIYYTPGSLKAKLCISGAKQLYQYCDTHGVKYKRVGKLIVAKRVTELPLLHNLMARSKANGVSDVSIIKPDEIRSIEPNCKGILAIYSKNTGIIDYVHVSRSYLKDFTLSGGTIHMNYHINRIQMNHNMVHIKSVTGDCIRSKYLITCCGLYSDTVSKMTGNPTYPKIIPFRGEYLKLRSGAHTINGNIYQTPDPTFPFLGVHFTPKLDGSVLIGPNAILATSKQGYKYYNVNLRDASKIFMTPGLWKLGYKYLNYGMSEIFNSISVGRQVKLLQEFVPSITKSDVCRGMSGVRAQAMDKSGKLVDDFVFDYGVGEFKNKILHIRNTPSPSATASLAIGKYIVNTCLNKLL